MAEIENKTEWLKSLPVVPRWSRLEREVLAWGLAFEGWVTPGEVGLECRDEALVRRFAAYARVGGVEWTSKEMWRWRVHATREMLVLLKAVLPFMPAKEEKVKAVIGLLEARVRRG